MKLKTFLPIAILCLLLVDCSNKQGSNAAISEKEIGQKQHTQDSQYVNSYLFVQTFINKYYGFSSDIKGLINNILDLRDSCIAEKNIIKELNDNNYYSTILEDGFKVKYSLDSLSFKIDTTKIPFSVDSKIIRIAERIDLVKIDTLSFNCSLTPVDSSFFVNSSTIY